MAYQFKTARARPTSSSRNVELKGGHQTLYFFAKEPGEGSTKSFRLPSG
jgi:hypothetical protein